MMLSITDHGYTVVVVFKLVHRVKAKMHNFNKGDFCLNKITCSLVYSVMNRLGNIGNFNLKQDLHYFLLGTLEHLMTMIYIWIHFKMYLCPAEVILQPGLKGFKCMNILQDDSIYHIILF
jgi:hypothetical protein